MVGIKSVFGIVLAVAALYVLKSGFPALAHLARPEPSFGLAAALLLAAGIAVGAVHLSFEGGALNIVRKTVGIAASVAGAFLVIG